MGERPEKTDHGKLRFGKLPFKKGDFLLVGAVVGLIVFLFSQTLGSDGSELRLRVTSRDSVRYYDLASDRTIQVEGPLGITTVVIGDGQAWIQESPCREKICVTMGRIKRPGQQAVCLPNRVIIELVGARREVDGVSR